MDSAAWIWVVVAAVAGVAAGVPIRAAVFHHGVPAGDPWRSACPCCEVPLVRPGWWRLRPSGRCSRCATAIGPPAAVVEVFAAVAAAGIAWRAGPHIATVALVWAALVAVSLGFVDAAVHRLPDRLIVTALAGTLAVFAAAVAAGTPYHRLVVAVCCGIVAGAGYLALVVVSPRGMGLGDAKLAVLVGLAAGWFGVRAALLACVAGIGYAGVAAIVLLALRRAARSDRLAYGPFMLLGALTAILVSR